MNGVRQLFLQRVEGGIEAARWSHLQDYILGMGEVDEHLACSVYCR